MWGNGIGFVPDDIPPHARLLVIGPSPGGDEERGQRLVAYSGRDKVYEKSQPHAFIGATGKMLRGRQIALTLLAPHEVGYMNVIRCRWRGANTPPTGETLTGAMKQCRVHDHLSTTITHVVTHGELALRMVAPSLQLTEWRGYECGTWNNRPVFATLHLESLYRDQRMAPVHYYDWQRIGRWIRGDWPRPLSEGVLRVNNLLLIEEGIKKFETAAITGPIAVDTEYTYDKNAIRGHYKLTMLGMGWRSALSGEVEGVQFDARFLSPEDMKVVLAALAQQVEAGRLWLFQNSQADLPVLEYNGGPPVEAWKGHFEDLMLYHHCLASEEPHSLEYLASVHGSFKKMKHLSASDLALYNWGDVVETLACWERLTTKGKLQPHSLAPYHEQLIPLVIPLIRSTQCGIPIRLETVKTLAAEESRKMMAAWLVASYHAGFPFSLSSVDFLKKYVCDYTKFIKRKAGGAVSLNKDVIADIRQKVGVDVETEKRHGMTVEALLENIHRGVPVVIEARAMWSHAQQLLSHFYLPLLRGGS